MQKQNTHPHILNTETQTYSTVTKTVKQIIYGWTCKFSYVQTKQQQKLACDERIKAKRKTGDRETESKKKIKPKRFLCVAPATAAKSISRIVGNDAELFVWFTHILFVTCLQNEAMNNLFNKLSEKKYTYTYISEVKSQKRPDQTYRTTHTHRITSKYKYKNRLNDF